MADSSKDIQLRELKDMIHDLQKMIKTLQATVDAANKREEALTQERDNLKEEVDLLRKKLFGTSSEKRVLDTPGQLNFLCEFFVYFALKQKRRRKNLPNSLILRAFCLIFSWKCGTILVRISH